MESNRLTAMNADMEGTMVIRQFLQYYEATYQFERWCPFEILMHT